MGSMKLKSTWIALAFALGAAVSAPAATSRHLAPTAPVAAPAPASNGRCITDDASSDPKNPPTFRTVPASAEPWVEPTAHPFVVLAKREGKNTEHAARSVLLRVTGQ